MTDRWAANPPLAARRTVNIDGSLVIRGSLTCSEDLVIEGQVEGQIDLPNHDLTTGPESRIHAAISARAVVVQGEVSGDITASAKVELTATSRVNGDIIAPLLTIADGARLRGSVDISGVPVASLGQEPSEESVSRQPERTPPVENSMSTLPRREFRPAAS